MQGKATNGQHIIMFDFSAIECALLVFNIRANWPIEKLKGRIRVEFFVVFYQYLTVGSKTFLMKSEKQKTCALYAYKNWFQRSLPRQCQGDVRTLITTALVVAFLGR